MKKFLIVLGSIFLAVIVLGAIGIAFTAIRGTALDKESKAYADSALRAIVSTWSEKELLDRASPEFKKAVTIDQLDRFFLAYYTTLSVACRSASQRRSIHHVPHLADRQYDHRSIRSQSNV